MEKTFERLSSNTLRQRIADRLREAILTGRLREGERLVERNLATEFQTSVTAVREALVQLETEGFVSKKPNSATHVTKLTLEAAQKIFTVRRLLETFAIEEAARAITPEQVELLEKMYVELLESAQAQDAQVFILKDLALHEQIWRLAGNEFLEVALRRIAHPIFAFTAIRVLSCNLFDLLQDAYSHLPIIEAIKAKRPEAARAAILLAMDEWFSKTRDFVFGQSSTDSTAQ